MATLLAGTETTANNTDNNVRGMDAAVYELEPDVSPLTVLLNAMGSVPAIAPKVEWLEDESMPRVTTLSASAASQAATLTVGPSADIFRVGDVVRVSSLGFGLLVTATAAGAITGTILGTTGLSAQTGTELYLVSNANAELATLREIKFTQLNTALNYCQIIRTPFGLSTTEMGQEHYGGPERARLSKHFGIDHAYSIENTHFFGFASISSVTRTAGGLQSFYTTNVTNDTGGLTEGDWQSFLRTGFRFGSGRKTAFCSPTAMSAIEGYSRGRFATANTGPAPNTFGVNMSTYVSGQGTVDLVLHRNWNDSAIYGGYVFLVDLDATRERPLQNVGKTQLLRDRQAPDYDGVKDEYRSETCVQVIHQRRGAILTGITAPTS